MRFSHTRCACFESAPNAEFAHSVWLQVQRTVRIRDRRLGFLYYGALFLIFVYIVVYVLDAMSFGSHSIPHPAQF